MLDERAGDGTGENCVSERWGDRAPPRQPVCESKNVMLERMQAALVALGKELRFVGGHVYLHWAFRLAGLATEAKIERLMNGLAFESFFAQCSGQHLPKQPCAAARGVLLLA